MEGNNPWYSGWESNEGYKHPILERYKPTLEALVDERIFSINKTKTGFCIFECCDEYFTHDLTKADCMELSELFRELAEELGQVQENNRKGEAIEPEPDAQCPV